MKDSPLLKNLNPEQKKAVTTTEGPLLILAGAGSGKTACITTRVAYLIKEKGVPPENILAITFTNKAANEMKERIEKLVGKAPVVAGTFHSLCAKILRLDGETLGIPKNFIIYDANDSKDLIKQAMTNLGIDPKSVSPNTIKNIISSAKNELINAAEYTQYARGLTQEITARVYIEYQKLLKQNNAVDFDDLLTEVVRLFNRTNEVLTKYQNRFRYLLVDEYQDTNHAQYMITKLLAKKWRNIAVCGDPDQSIYSFRGADISNILEFEKDYPECTVIKLEQNYRSTKTILTAAHEVIRHNRARKDKKLWTENEIGVPISLYGANNEIDEANFLIRNIDQLRLPLSSFAVLYRTNAQSRVIEEAFLHAGIPYKLYGGTRFYERKEVKDVLSYLRLVENKNDSVSQKRAEKIGKNRLKKLTEYLETEKNAAIKAPLQTLDEILIKTGYLETLDDGTEEGKNRIENVKELRSVASGFQDLAQFLENVALVENEYLPDGKLKNEQDQEAVSLMTLHAAKGLEFPVVFIVGMEEGLFPHSRTLLSPHEIEEERRLCYVGLTRSRQQLFLTHAQQRLYFGSKLTNLISRFIIDIPEELLTGKG